jgi:hypothetical protein
MNLTNRNNLPSQVLHWLTEFNQHNEDERARSIAELEAIFGPHKFKISATSMLKSVKEVILTDRHYEEIEKDATDVYDAIVGTAIHESFRTMPMREGEMREIRTGASIKDVLVTGQFDYILNSKLGDYKSTKIGSYVFGDKEYEYVAQLSVNRYLFRVDPRFGQMLADQGEIIMLFTDWRDREYKTKKYGFSDVPNYPHRAVELNVDLWDIGTTEKFINKKITDYKIASMGKDEELPLCSDKERWMRVTKKATTYAKCEQYCSVKPWCVQWRQQ